MKATDSNLTHTTNKCSNRKEPVRKPYAGVAKATIYSRSKKGKVKGVKYDYLHGKEYLTPSTSCLPCEITDYEILAYYPRHLTWPRVTMRLVENDWRQAEMARYMNFVRGFHGRDSFKPNTITKQIQKAAKIEGLGCKFKLSEYTPTLTTDISTAGYEPRINKMLDNIRLATLGDGIVNFPSCREAGHLTRSIRFALEHPDMGFTIRDHNFWVRYGIVPPEYAKDQPEADPNHESTEQPCDEDGSIGSAKGHPHCGNLGR